MYKPKKKVLQVKYPPITTFPGYANTLSILSNYEKTFDWIYSHYIQIFAIDLPNRSASDYSDAGCFFVDYDPRRLANITSSYILLNREGCPFLHNYEVPNSLVLSMGISFETFIKQCIDLSSYVISLVDVSKIKAYNRDSELSHDMFIYGYDDDEGVFYYADFPNNASNQYNYSKCSYQEMENAFESITNASFPYLKTIAFAQYCDYRTYVLDMSFVRETIRDYLYPNRYRAQQFNKYIEARYAFAEWKSNVYLGVELYDYLSDYIGFELGLGKKRVSVVLYHAMYDHKELMLLRLKYLLENSHLAVEKLPLVREYQKVKDICLMIRNQITKYNATQNSAILPRIRAALGEAKDLEVRLLSEIFDVHRD